MRWMDIFGEELNFVVQVENPTLNSTLGGIITIKYRIQELDDIRDKMEIQLLKTISEV
jgi:hypothetical protein